MVEKKHDAKKGDLSKSTKGSGVLKNINNLMTEKLMMYVIGIFIILLLVNSLSIVGVGKVVDVKVEELKEVTRPAEIQLTTIQANCKDCFDVSSIIENLKNDNVNVTGEQVINSSSQEAQELILKYNIDRLPSLLIFGETDRANLNNFELENDALVFSGVTAPFVDSGTNEVKGLVSITNLFDPLCNACPDYSLLSSNFEKLGATISEFKNVEYNSAEGRELVKKFGIDKIPAILISTEIDYYDEIKKSLSQSQLRKQDGFYVIPSTNPPYRDLATKKIAGLVDLIMLVDGSCGECYDVNINKQILAGLGIIANSENVYDVTSVYVIFKN